MQEQKLLLKLALIFNLDKINMNCPKCNVELKPAARFCHVCGFEIKSEITTQVPVNPTPPPAQQPAQPQQQQTTPQYQYQQQQQQFSYQRQQQPAYAPQAAPKSGSSGSMIAGIVALVGAVGVFLPWAKVSFWGISSSASGIEAWQGVIALISLIAFGLLNFMGDKINMEIKTRKLLNIILSVIPSILSLWVLFRVIDQPMVSLGIGLIITSSASVISFFMGLTKSPKSH